MRLTLPARAGILAVLALVLGLMAAPAQASYDYAAQYSSGDTPFSQPFGVAVDGQGNIFVADTGNNRIEKLDADGHFVTKWGAPGEFAYPYGVSVDPAGNVLVADRFHNQIQVYTNSGAFIRRFGSGILTRPVSSVVAPSGNIYVADSDASRIVEFGPTGAFITAFGTGQLNTPYGVTADANSVYVADTYNGQGAVRKYTLGGDLQQSWPGGYSGDGKVGNPTGIAIDASGHVLVAEMTNRRVEEFDTNGNYVAQFGSMGSGPGQFYQPEGIAVDSDGNVYVADPGNNRITKFGHESAPVVVDADGDGVADADDNCPNVANADQADLDGDHQGDACDGDVDGDGAANGSDAFPNDPSESVDTDGDGIGNNADTDDDNDGVVDSQDSAPLDNANARPSSGDQCKKNGWTKWKVDGVAFKNQGDCVSWIATDGRNAPAGE